MRRAGWLAWVTVVVVAASASAQAPRDVVGEARREGRVVVYGSMESDIFDVVRKIYEGRYGIPVEYWRAPNTRVLDRVLTELRTGRVGFDVVLTNAAAMKLMKRHGAFARYSSPSYELFPRGSQDPDGVLSPAYRLTPLSILYNTRSVRAQDVPKSVGELGDPRWRGKVVLADPTVNVIPATWLLGLRRQLGTQWRTFVEQLAANATLVESVLEVAQKVVAGEYPLGVSFIKYVHLFGKEGAPLDYVRLNPVLALPSHVAVGARAAHPAAAGLFVDTLTSRAGLLALAQAGEFVLVPGVYPPIKDADRLRVVVMEEPSEEEFQRARAEFAAVFRRR
jgi:iron(III) transport system substrate-binding protein